MPSQVKELYINLASFFSNKVNEEEKHSSSLTLLFIYFPHSNVGVAVVPVLCNVYLHLEDCPPLCCRLCLSVCHHTTPYFCTISYSNLYILGPMYTKLVKLC